MTDRFKFRAWDTVACRYEYEIQYSLFDYYIDDDRYVIEQCTGLKDKNGRLIYEGDIVKFREIGVITWSKYAPAFICEKDGWNVADVGKKLEIIGNIHENPELLEEK